MARRILLLDTSPPLVAALRRFLKGTDLEVHVSAPSGGLDGVDLGQISVAAVRPATPRDQGPGRVRSATAAAQRSTNSGMSRKSRGG